MQCTEYKKLRPTPTHSHGFNENYFYNENYYVKLFSVSFSCSVVSDSFATPWTVACQDPLSMGFPRQECCGGLPFPSPGILPHQGLNPHLLHWHMDSLPLSHLGSPDRG